MGDSSALGAAGEGRVVLGGGGDGGGGTWTVLVPTAVAAEWTGLTIGGGRAGEHSAARATASTGFADGGSGYRVPEMAIDIAALLAESGTSALGLGEGFKEHVGAGGDFDGRRGQGGGVEIGPGVAGGGAAGLGGAAGGLPGRTSGERVPYFVPIVFVPNVNIRETDPKDSWLNKVKVIFGLLLLGSLGFVNSLKDVLRTHPVGTHPVGGSVLWFGFATVWGLLSVGFHMSLGRQINRLRRAYIEFIAHLSLVLFCGLVMFYLYLNIPREVMPRTFLLEMVCILMVLHIVVWYRMMKDPQVSSEDASAPRRSRDDMRGVNIEVGAVAVNNGANGGNDNDDRSVDKKKE